MPDQLRNPRVGPDAMYSTELPPSRGQHETIARLACELFGVPLNNRLEATIAISRLQLSLQSDQAPPALRSDPITEF